MNATFDRLALVSTRTWWRVTITTGVVNVANFAMDLTFGHPYSATVGIPVSLVATGTSIASTAMRAKRRRLDEHERLAIEAEQKAKAELERKWRADVYRVAFPDPGPDQCPVCGLDDLAFFVQADAFTGDTGGPMARVVAYGPVFAHRECAQIVPYDKYYAKTPECRHRLGYHHAYPEGASTRPIGCAACDRERDTGAKEVYPAPDDCACYTCQGSRRDAQRETATPSPPPDDRWWDGFADIQYVRRDGVHRYVWTCRYCPASCAASTREHAESALKDHARVCVGSALGRMLTSMDMPTPRTPYARVIEYGYTPQLRAIKGALSPKQDPMQWLYDAAKSADPGLREAAWAAIRRIRGI